ncbi:protein rigor mortis [Anopheles aquasalis]|uniref:protein rigor mortis n=1 Tax=Anopheles aquasalis TaxID=42839 RepID=UPI00215A10E6|nr:protein rigor mortis [Anopheles aquasalis]
MDGFTVPIVQGWFHQNSIVSTPDNGVLYCGRFEMCYVPPIDSTDELPKVKIIGNETAIKCFACAPDWSEKRTYAIMDAKNRVVVWDLDSATPIQGHRAHPGPPKELTKPQQKDITSALCFSTNNQLLSCDRGSLVIYCLLLNRFQVHLNFFRRKDVVVALSRVPGKFDMFVAGMRDGLVQIFSIKTMSKVHSLRAHDREIVSIDLMMVSVEGQDRKPTDKAAKESKPTTAEKERPRKQARKKPIPEADSSDFLDIYDFNDNQEEFGTIIDRESNDSAREKFHEKTKTVEGFNFLEACQNLKEDIMEAAARREDDEDDDDERVSGEELNTDDENDLDDCEKLRDYVVVDSDEEELGAEDAAEVEEDAVERKLILVTGSRENVIWFWDFETGLPIDKVTMQCDGSKRLCNTTFINAVWLDECHIVANNAAGQVFENKVQFVRKQNKLGMISSVSLAPYPVEKIFHVIRGNAARYIWCSSINRKLSCVHVAEDGKPTVVREYSCMIPTNRFLVEHPLEPMVVAVATSVPRIEVINLLTMKPDNVQLRHFTNKIGGVVMTLAWHPEQEEKLAFATNEGRIGLFDTKNANNVPVLLKSFTNKDIYAISWCYLTDEKGQRRMILLACGKSDLAYYYVTGQSKHVPNMCTQFRKVSHVSAAGNLCFVGTQEGHVYVADLDQNFKQLYHRSVAQRYITSLEYKNKRLAVGDGKGHIVLINFKEGYEGTDENHITPLEGHDGPITGIRWSHGEKMHLVSTCYDGTIRIWDAESTTCLKIVTTGNIVNSAVFSSLDENIILYVGVGHSLSCFDYTKAQPNCKSGSKPNIQYASANQVGEGTDSSKVDTVPESDDKPNVKKRHNSKAKNTVSTDAIDELVDKVAQVVINGRKATNPENTPFTLTHREAGRTDTVLECIVKLLHSVETEPDDSSEKEAESEESDQDADSNESSTNHNQDESGTKNEAPSEEDAQFYNEKLFSTEAKLQQLIQEETNHAQQVQKPLENFVLLPQLLYKLKDKILECISKKKLTAELLALTPYVSHVFWRQCCKAYAYQLIETNKSMASIPYFLASFEIDELLEVLCEKKHFREAWAICRLQTLPDDPWHEKIGTAWASYLESNGNLEPAALVWTGIKKYEEALRTLSKRKEQSKEIVQTVDALKAKIQDTKPKAEPETK